MTNPSPWMHAGIPTHHGFPTFPEGEIARRHAKLRALMAELEADLIIAYGAGRFNAEMLYLSNWPGGREGFVLLPAAGEPTLLVQFFNHVPLAVQLSRIPDTRWAGSDSIRTISDCIRERGITPRRIGLIGPWTARDRDHLLSCLPDTEILDITPNYRSQRLIRSPEELAFFRLAAELTDRSMEALEAELQPGVREYELAAIVENAYLQRGGYAGIHFMSSTSMASPQAFVPHQYQSDRILRPGDVLITEISGSFWGYASQIHRTYTIGSPPTTEYAALHEVAVEAFGAVVGVLRDGASVEDVLDAAEVIHRSGYTIVDDLLHGADQYPPILRTWATDHGHLSGFRFAEDMVVTVQPHIVTPNQRIGVQFGETVRITRDGVESLHDYRRDVITVSG
jgi:Xaa-Pro dipeptidase